MLTDVDVVYVSLRNERPSQVGGRCPRGRKARAVREATGAAPPTRSTSWPAPPPRRTVFWSRPRGTTGTPEPDEHSSSSVSPPGRVRSRPGSRSPGCPPTTTGSTPRGGRRVARRRPLRGGRRTLGARHVHGPGRRRHPRCRADRGRPHHRRCSGRRSTRRARIEASIDQPESQGIRIEAPDLTVELADAAFTSWSEATFRVVRGRYARDETFAACDAYQLMVEAVSARAAGQDAWVLPLPPPPPWPRPSTPSRRPQHEHVRRSRRGPSCSDDDVDPARTDLGWRSAVPTDARSTVPARARARQQRPTLGRRGPAARGGRPRGRSRRPARPRPLGGHGRRLRHGDRGQPTSPAVCTSLGWTGARDPVLAGQSWGGNVVLTTGGCARRCCRRRARRRRVDPSLPTASRPSRSAGTRSPRHASTT